MTEEPAIDRHYKRGFHVFRIVYCAVMGFILGGLAALVLVIVAASATHILYDSMGGWRWKFAVTALEVLSILYYGFVLAGAIWGAIVSVKAAIKNAIK